MVKYSVCAVDLEYIMDQRDDEVVILPLGELVSQEVTRSFSEEEFAQWWASLSGTQKDIVSEGC